MAYLITQILLCLLIAFLLGMLLGYLLCKMCGCAKQSSVATDDVDSDLEEDVDPAEYGAAYIDDLEETTTIDLDTNVDLDSDAYHIETLEGIGPQTGELLRGYGVATIGDFLRKLHTPASREDAAKELNILVKPLHDWASMADLLRVEGITHQYAELAYMVGITTVSQLANSNADELVVEMEAVNNAGKQLIAPNVPSADEVLDWIARARGMSPVVSVS